MISWLASLWIKEWTPVTLSWTKCQDVKFGVPSQQAKENARSEVRTQKGIADAAGLGRAERNSWSETLRVRNAFFFKHQSWENWSAMIQLFTATVLKWHWEVSPFMKEVLALWRMELLRVDEQLGMACGSWSLVFPEFLTKKQIQNSHQTSCSQWWGNATFQKSRGFYSH